MEKEVKDVGVLKWRNKWINNKKVHSLSQLSLIWRFNDRRLLMHKKRYCIVSEGKRRRHEDVDFLWKNGMPLSVGDRLELFSTSLANYFHCTLFQGRYRQRAKSIPCRSFCVSRNRDFRLHSQPAIDLDVLWNDRMRDFKAQLSERLWGIFNFHKDIKISLNSRTNYSKRVVAILLSDKFFFWIGKIFINYAGRQ